MALAKTDGIESIRGKMGGNVFRKDNSGQHVYAKPRQVRKHLTPKQKKQTGWYAGKKKEEYAGGTEVEQYEEPKKTTTAVVFSLEVAWAHRKPSLSEPQQNPIIESADLYVDLYFWVYNNPDKFWHLIGMDDHTAWLLVIKWSLIYYHIKGYTWWFAMAASKVELKALVVAQVGSFMVPVLTLWVGLLALTFYFSFLDWLEGVSGFVSFTKGRVLIKTKTGLFWGNLVERPSKKMYDFRVCSLTNFGSYQWHRNPDTPKYMQNWLHLYELWTTTQRSFLWWYVYGWQSIRLRHRGYAYVVDDATVRLLAPPSQIEYWGQPVGWKNPDWQACNYPNQLEDYFEYQGHPAPPL